MLRVNRTRVLGLACLVLFVYYLLVSDSASTNEFRKTTEAGLARKHNSILRGDRLTDEELTAATNDQLQGILAGEPNPGASYKAPVDKNGKAADADETRPNGPPQKAVGAEKDEISVAGRKTMPRPAVGKDAKYVKDNSDAQGPLKEDDGGQDVSVADDPGKDKARELLSTYLKNPIVIFSKTYCPHSRRAKELLLDIYKITPTPLVVEIDELTDRVPENNDSDSNSDGGQQTTTMTTMGAKLQDLLKEVTGRRTVPNIVVGGGHSIGGNDIIWEMHQNNLLGAEIMKFGGKRITSLDLREADKEKDAGKEGHGLKS